MKLETILSNHHKNLAIIIGNGINLHDNNGARSWEDLLVSLQKIINGNSNKIPEHLSLTEFYDLLDLSQSSSFEPRESLQKGFANLMKEWEPGQHHKNIVRWCESKNVPILTTNFENTLGKAVNCKKSKRIKYGKFTDYYPWSTYYAPSHIENPESDFAIWHINGMQKHYRSIRLGLGHYMGSVSRARNWLHGGKEDSLFYGKNQNRWRGHKSWLQCIFNNDLLIFGLGLGTQEVFLRWLFIERAKYFKKFPDRKKRAWFIEKSDSKHTDHWRAKKFFLEGVGVSTIQVKTHSEIYANKQWKQINR